MNSSCIHSYSSVQKFLRILFSAMIAGQLLFFIVAFFLKGSVRLNSTIYSMLDYIIPLLLLAALILSRILFRALMLKTRKSSLDKKLISYRSAVIINLALLEAANFIAITSFLLTSEYLYAAASLIIFLLFVLRNPTDDRLVTDLELTSEELSRIK